MISKTVYSYVDWKGVHAIRAKLRVLLSLFQMTAFFSLPCLPPPPRHFHFLTYRLSYHPSDHVYMHAIFSLGVRVTCSSCQCKTVLYTFPSIKSKSSNTWQRNSETLVCFNNSRTFKSWILLLTLIKCCPPLINNGMNDYHCHYSKKPL